MRTSRGGAGTSRGTNKREKENRQTVNKQRNEQRSETINRSCRKKPATTSRSHSLTPCARWPPQRCDAPSMPVLRRRVSSQSDRRTAARAQHGRRSTAGALVRGGLGGHGVRAPAQRARSRSGSRGPRRRMPHAPPYAPRRPTRPGPPPAVRPTHSRAASCAGGQLRGLTRLVERGRPHGGVAMPTAGSHRVDRSVGAEHPAATRERRTSLGSRC